LPVARDAEVEQLDDVDGGVVDERDLQLGQHG
jgi:hypothetical protein